MFSAKTNRSDSLTGQFLPYQPPVREVWTPQALGMFVGLVAVGVAGNVLRYPVFFNIEFLFGSIATMIALQVLGPHFGVATGLLVSSSTWWLWNHPYAILIMTAEVAVVSLLCRRRALPLVMADALYWLFLGMPLVLLFYHLVMGMTLATASVTMLKQALNGITNALLARVMVMVASYARRQERFPLRDVVFNLLATFVMAPSLLLLAQQSRAALAEADLALRGSITSARERANVNLERWLEEHWRLVRYLADSAPREPLAEWQEAFDHVRATNPDFLRLGGLDAADSSVVFSPVAENGASNLGRFFGDRAVVQEVRRTGQDSLSEVVISRLGERSPIVILVSPVLRDGIHVGVVTGALDLAAVRRILALEARSHQLPDLRYTLLDKHGQVIVSSQPNVPALQPFHRGDGALVPLDAAVSQWIPRLKANVSVTSRWMDSLYVTEAALGPHGEWTLLLEQPLAPTMERLFHDGSVKMAWVLALLMMGLALAEALSRRLITSLSQLAELSSGLPAKVSAQDAVPWVDTHLLETQQLQDNFRDMAGALAREFRAIRDMNTTLEQRVQERTQELRESEEKYRVLFDNEGYAISIFDVQSLRLLDVNDAYVALYGYTREELTSGMTIHDVTAQRQETTAATQRAVEQGTTFIPLRYHRKKDGTVFPVEIVGGPYTWKGRRVMFALAHDITARVRDEAALQEKTRLLEELTHTLEKRVASEVASRRQQEQVLMQQSKLASMGEMLGAIAHQWRQPLNTLGLCVQNLADAYSMGELTAEYLHASVAKSVDHIRLMSRTIDDFRSFFQPDKEPVVFDVVNAVQHVLGLLAAQHQAHGILVRLTHGGQEPPLPPCTVRGFRNEFEHVVLNLLANAQDAIAGRAPGEPGVITVDVHQREQRVVVQVRDNGSGIPESARARLFEPYFTTKAKGTGIGLYMSRTIVQDHLEGTLTVQDVPQGACFTLELPGAAP